MPWMTHFDRVRRGFSDPENSLIDDYRAGRVDRRAFMRHAALLGLSLPAGGLLLAGPAAPLIGAARAATPGATIKIGTEAPTGAIDPMTIGSTGGLAVICQTGDFLTVSDQNLVLQPSLALSWKPNQDGTVWTFVLRQDVKFHDGRPMTADDVVATIERLADPANSSNALSVFKGTLSKGGTRKVDPYTVEFHLDAPNGNFPYYVSSDNYNAIILPKDYAGDYEKTFIGTGPFKLESYAPKSSVSLVRNETYWGGPVLPARVVFNFFEELQAMVVAMQGGQVDVITRIPVHGAQSLLTNPDIDILTNNCTGHTQLHLRTDAGLFSDKRVRQALALSLDREALRRGLFLGRAALGNDNPFAPAYPSTDTSVPQRKQDLQRAMELVRAAGAEKGKATLAAGRYEEIPDYAVLVQNSARRIGLDIDLKIESSGAYYGKSVFGQSDWLDSTLGITDYAHRGIPNVVMSACYGSAGTWNAAHFKNKQFDALAAQYVAALDLATQRGVAKQIQELLLDETPIIISYYFDALTPVRKKLKNVRANALSQLRLTEASLA